MTRYDYPDPGQDSDYCDGLSDESTNERCFWCSQLFAEDSRGGYYPYCGPQCAISAERDSEEDN